MVTIQNAIITAALFCGFYALYVVDIFALTIERDPYKFDMIAFYAAAAFAVSAWFTGSLRTTERHKT